MRDLISNILAVIFTPDESLKRSLRGHLEDLLEIKAESSNYYSSFDNWLFEELKQLKPDLVVVDLSKDAGSGIHTIQKLQELSTPPAVFIVHDHADPDVIIRAMRAGASEFLVKPIRKEQLLDAVYRVAKQRENILRSKQVCKAFTFFSSKGGGGATTLATNFAVNLANLTRKPVVLLDLNLQFGGVDLFLGLIPKFTVADAMENLGRLDMSLLDGLIVKHSSGLHILAAPDQMKKAEAITASQVMKLITFLKGNYNYIVIDTSNSFDEFTISAFDCSDKIFLVTGTDLPSLRNTQKCLRVLDLLSYKKEKIRLLVNRYLKGKELDLKEIEKALNHNVYWTFPNDYPTVIAAISKGVSLAPSSAGMGQSVRKFAQQVLGLKATELPTQKKGILSSILNREKKGVLFSYKEAK